MPRDDRRAIRGPVPVRRLVVLGCVLVVLIAGLAAVAVRLSARTAAPGTGPSLPYSNLMQLSPIQAGYSAPGFSLVDEHGRSMSLSSFRGRVVVLEFMDPHCVDICPIVSREFVDAYHDLGSARNKVVFAAVNVNPFHTSVASVAAFSRNEGLDSVPSWQFFTGPVTRLRAVWKAYGIYVHAPSPTIDVQHSSEVFFISPRGSEAYLASPAVDHRANHAAFLPARTVARWGQGIAYYASKLAAS